MYRGLYPTVGKYIFMHTWNTYKSWTAHRLQSKLQYISNNQYYIENMLWPKCSKKIIRKIS